jgi:hypothetical protein
MVRYTLAVKGAPRDSTAAMVVEEQEVDIYNGAQLAEKYLLEVNPKGQVRIPFPKVRFIAFRTALRSKGKQSSSLILRHRFPS